MRGRTFTAALLKQLEPKGAPTRTAARRDAVVEGEVPLHDPLLEPRDEAVFLLTAAAEIEHALMAQYLYAGYSVRVAGDSAPKLEEIQNLLFQVAREEMGHLATVQNLLHLIGGPLNLNREHSPYASEIYPFRFKLEPLSRDSLAKYVIAESPEQLPDDFPKGDEELLKQLVKDAKRSNDGRPVRHVGPIFARLKRLFEGGEDGLGDEDFRLDRLPLQATFEDWGLEARSRTVGESLIVESFGAAEVAQVRAKAAAAVEKIGAQGEGFDLPPASLAQSESHFERFFDLHRRFRELDDADVKVTWPVAENPNTTEPPKEPADLKRMVDAVEEAYAARGRITHPRALAWAHLFNLRYRLLLGCLSHFLRLRQELYVAGPGPQRGDRTARGLLLIWTFTEMRRLKKIAGKLVQLPLHDPPDGTHAGPPFELPYTLNLPESEEDRWRTHLDVSRASVWLIRERLQPADADEGGDGFLADLVARDKEAQIILASLAAGTGVPPGSLPSDFQKAVLILEEAVRGFDFPRDATTHRSFWADKNRQQFLDTTSPAPLLAKNPQGGPDFNPDRSTLINFLQGPVLGRPRMPRFRPRVPAERLGFLRDWITKKCPDNDPPGQKGLRRERDPASEPVPEVPPAGTQPPGFAADIRPLFRDSPDRDSMLLIANFDLHSLDDVRAHAESIRDRLMDGTMPCDGAWSAERIAIFRRWIEGGKRP
jgi:Ferritin-like